MSCCDDIIVRMRADVAPGAFTAELSNGSLISFDRAYLEHAGPETVELLQAGPDAAAHDRRVRRAAEGARRR